jgi:hypothetical protein
VLSACSCDVGDAGAASQFGYTGSTLTHSGLAFISPGAGQPIFLGPSAAPAGQQSITPVDSLASTGQASSVQLSSAAGGVAAVGSPNKRYGARLLRAACLPAPPRPTTLSTSTRGAEPGGPLALQPRPEGPLPGSQAASSAAAASAGDSQPALCACRRPVQPGRVRAPPHPSTHSQAAPARPAGTRCSSAATGRSCSAAWRTPGRPSHSGPAACPPRPARPSRRRSGPAAAWSRLAAAQLPPSGPLRATASARGPSCSRCARLRVRLCMEGVGGGGGSPAVGMSRRLQAATRAGACAGAPAASTEAGRSPPPMCPGPPPGAAQLTRPPPRAASPAPCRSGTTAASPSPTWRLAPSPGATAPGAPCRRQPRPSSSAPRARPPASTRGPCRASARCAPVTWPTCCTSPAAAPWPWQPTLPAG